MRQYADGDETMTAESFSKKILNALQKMPATFEGILIDPKKSRNTAACMTNLLCNRLRLAGKLPEPYRRTTYAWSGGILNIRNAAHRHYWTNIRLAFAKEFHTQAKGSPGAYLLAWWNPHQDLIHSWAIPEPIVYQALSHLPAGKSADKRMVVVKPGHNIFEQCDDSPDLTPYHGELHLSSAELNSLTEAYKTDRQLRQQAQEDDTTPPMPVLTDTDDPDLDKQPDESPGFTSDTVAFLKELPSHTADSKWHGANKERYEAVLRDPTLALVALLKEKYIEQLDPEVAGGKRHTSMLKKNDYGKGGYYDHYWFAFYDPSAESKTKSAQLFLKMDGNPPLWRYGFSMGSYCQPYLERLKKALLADADKVAQYMASAPAGTLVRLHHENNNEWTAKEWRDLLLQNPKEAIGAELEVQDIDIIREYVLDTLPQHGDHLVDEVGQYFVWAWPFFQASRTGKWLTSPPDGPKPDDDVDEEAPKTLAELSDRTSLPFALLRDIEDSLLAKQQVVLVGPPGTSKTYIARQFARYFVRQRPDSQQGKSHVLYMHSNWTYEDFFEGMKPVEKNGTLLFERTPGFFLKWVEKLKGYSPGTRHAIVLDELNRCDTAAVIGELLQLLEHRGNTVTLLSGRSFVLPRNLYVIGTMNSADRSIGRLDLALRRRFLWIDLYPSHGILAKWLERKGNNPVGFHAEHLKVCNDLLSSTGIPVEQHIGHALFMVQESTGDGDVDRVRDVPLTDNHLERIVRFSVLPYVKELFMTHVGQINNDIVSQIQTTLLQCLITKA